MKSTCLAIFALTLCLVLSGCATGGLNGTFVPQTYIDDESNIKGESLGSVSGESSQTWFLYLFPVGDAPSTGNAIQDAKNQINGTEYLSDVSIDNRILWKLGYRELVITVDAEARN